jgi:hypothetical protein
LIIDNEGKQFRANGFRRVRKISSQRGAWIVQSLKLVVEAICRDGSRCSVWNWYYLPMRQLLRVTAPMEKAYLNEADPIAKLRHRSKTCGHFWAGGLPYWLLAETCLVLADRIDLLEAKLGGTPPEPSESDKV